MQLTAQSELTLAEKHAHLTQGDSIQTQPKESGRRCLPSKRETRRKQVAQAVTEVSLPACTPDENFFPTKHQESLRMCPQELWRLWGLRWEAHIWNHPDSSAAQVWVSLRRNSMIIAGRKMMAEGGGGGGALCISGA